MPRTESRRPHGKPAGAREPSPASRAAAAGSDRDPLGKMALFSSDQRPPAFGTLLVECSSCHRETPVSAAQLVRAALPVSLHLPVVRHYHSFMRCPACGRRTWLRVLWKM